MKKPKKLSPPEPASLTELDWNFDAVPDDELVACCYWEYARESAFIRDVRRRFSDPKSLEYDRGIAWEFVGKDAERIESIGYEAEVFLRGFYYDEWRRNYPPLTRSFPASWQILEEDERKERARIRNDIEVLQLRPFQRDGTITTAEDLLENAKEVVKEHIAACDKLHLENPGVSEHVLRQQGKYPPYEPSASVSWDDASESLIVKIDWQHFTNDEIAEAFRRWVKANRPKDVRKPDARGHKPGDWRAHLTRLAAMRLLSRYTRKEILGTKRTMALAECRPIHSTKQFASNKWGDPTKWHDARREAGRLFRTLFPFLPADEKPLSWERQKPAQ